MKVIEEGTELTDVAAYLDRQKTHWVGRINRETGYPSGHELREVVDAMGGDWIMYLEEPEGTVFNIPYRDSTIIIERPCLDVSSRSYTGHRVAVVGDLDSRTVRHFLEGVHNRERELKQELGF